MNSIEKIFILSGVLSSVFCLTQISTFNHPIWLIPVTYTISMLLCRRNIIKNTPGIIFFNILMFMRYVFTPVAYYRDGVINTMISSELQIDDGLVLMLYELVAVFITINITGKKYQTKFYNFKILISGYKKICVLELKNRVLALIVVLLTIIYIGYFYKSLGQGLSVFTSGSYNEFGDIEFLMGEGEGYINIIWQSLCVWLYFYLLMRERKKYDISPKLITVVRSILYTIIFVIITFVDSTGITRWYTLVTASASLACLLSLFPTHKKVIGSAILVPLVVLMALSSLIKNGGYESGEKTVSESAEGILGATTMDVYFNGLGNVNTIFRINKYRENIGLETIFSDVLSTMPVVNHYISKESTSARAFHRAVGRNDQIIPMVGQSYIYFGFLLSPLLSILSIILLRKMDYRYYYDYTYTKYAYAFAAIWFGSVVMCLNLTITFMWLYIRVLPFFLILWYTNTRRISN